jgi:hypothetical protein
MAPAGWLALALAVAAALAGVGHATETAEAQIMTSNCGPVVTQQCCNGLVCVHANGVCCEGGRHCCPSNMRCLPLGADNVQLCGWWNTTRPVPKPKWTKTGVKITEFPVRLQLDITNFVFQFYTNNKDYVEAMLKRDIARDDPVGIEAVDIVRVEALRIPTPGNLDLERSFVERRRQELARQMEEQNAKRNVREETEVDRLLVNFVEEKAHFAPMSGIRVFAVVYAPTDRDGISFARSVMLLRAVNRFPLLHLNTLPDESKANLANDFEVAASSKVIYKNSEVSNVQGLDITSRAQRAAANGTSVVQRARKRLQTIQNILRDQKRNDRLPYPWQIAVRERRRQILADNHRRRVQDLGGREFESPAVPPPPKFPDLPGPLPTVGNDPQVPAL